VSRLDDLAARRALLVATATVQRTQLVLHARLLRLRSAALVEGGRRWSLLAATGALAALSALSALSAGAMLAGGRGDAAALSPGEALAPATGWPAARRWLRIAAEVFALWRAWNAWRVRRAQQR
jgi:hypothetical protein